VWKGKRRKLKAKKKEGEEAFELGEEDAALIFRNEDGKTRLELLVPEQREKEAVYKTTLFATVIAIMLKTDDKEFGELIGKKAEEFHKLAKEAEKKEGENGT
jgi:hypothetical protein